MDIANDGVKHLKIVSLTSQCSTCASGICFISLKSGYLSRVVLGF